MSKSCKNICIMKIYTLIMIKFSFIHYNNFCLSLSEYKMSEFIKYIMKLNFQKVIILKSYILKKIFIVFMNRLLQ